MKDKRSLHQRIQELCDCYATTDYLKEMAQASNEPDKEEGALKWIALGMLHGITSSAEKITIVKNPDGTVEVTAKYKDVPLPSPGTDVGSKVLEILKNVIGIEAEKGKSLLALGVRDSSLELEVKYEKEDETETVTLKFPSSK